MKLAALLTVTMCLFWPFLAPAAAAGSPGDAAVTVDLAVVVNVMRGGIGASWHAIEQPIPYSTKPDPVFGSKSQGGSGWGAYPPAEDDAAWQQIDRHARWLGFDWNRVELEQRIYEPERGQFTWDNPEMRILYRILDWCQKNKADVFLQQMWGNVKLEHVPRVARRSGGPGPQRPGLDGGFRRRAWPRWSSTWSRTKGYTCIRWVCIINEPNGKLVLVAAAAQQAMPLKPGLAAVRKALDAKGLRIPLSGPDLTGGVPAAGARQRFDFHDLLGAYDFHSYDENFDWLGEGADGPASTRPPPPGPAGRTTNQQAALHVGVRHDGQRLGRRSSRSGQLTNRP